jgi:2-oxoglutarate ferredoxin oxidoreductase subunit gamma
MQNEIVIAGFGGQGALLAGTLIAQAAIEQGLHTTWVPSYGAEMRGGTTNSTVVISSDEIGSPLAFNPDVLVALNEPSLNKFISRVIDNAIVIANSSIIPQNTEYKVRPYFIPVTDIADKEIKNLRTANTVAVGTLIRVLELHRFNAQQNTDKKGLTLKSVLSACEKIFASKPQLIKINKKAIQAGYDFIK